ncbi:MAG: hypothetical protein ACRCZ0_08690 [Cetobacterium sp.]
MKNHLNLEVLNFDGEYRVIQNGDFGFLTIGIYETEKKALKIMNSLLLNR